MPGTGPLSKAESAHGLIDPLPKGIDPDDLALGDQPLEQAGGDEPAPPVIKNFLSLDLNTKSKVGFGYSHMRLF